jgi:hypothetical protein
MDEGMIWHVQDFTSTEADLVAARGLRHGLGLETGASLRHITSRIHFLDPDRRPLTLPNGSIHHRNETLVRPGDPWVMLHGARGLRGWSVEGRAGISIPLGRTEPNPFELGRLGLPHEHVQFGTGTWDPMIEAGVGRRIGEWNTSLTTHARFVVSTNDHGYRAGDRYHASANAERHVAGRWRGAVGVDLVREETETWNGRREEEGNLGRTDVLASVSAARPLGARNVLTFALRVPLVTRASGSQLSYPLIASVGLSWGPL